MLVQNHELCLDRHLTLIPQRADQPASPSHWVLVARCHPTMERHMRQERSSRRGAMHTSADRVELSWQEEMSWPVLQ